MATKKKTKKAPAVRAAATKTKPKVVAKKARGSSKTPPKGRAPTKRLAKKVALTKRPAKKAAPTKRPAKKAAPTKRPAKKTAAKKGPTAKVAAKGGTAKQAASAKRAAPTSTPVAKAPPMRRRDGAGHLDPHYAATLREKSREGQVRDRDDAFIGRSGHSGDDLAEALGETWVATATSGEDENEDVFNQKVPEDEGGPFVTTTAAQEFADGTDASNPKWSKREPFPKT